MRRTLLTGAASAVALVAAMAPSGTAGTTALALGSIVRITTPGTSLCPAEGEPEVTHTRLGTWVAYNDDHQCPWLPTLTRIEEVQLVPAQGRPKFIPLDAPQGQVVSGDPDLSPAPDGGVYVATLWSGAAHEGALSLRVLHVDRQLHVHELPTPSFHGDNNSDDKEFIAVDSGPGSPFAGRLYVVWDDFYAGTTAFRAWDGKHWLRPVELQKGAGAPDVAVGPGGIVAATMESTTGSGAIVRVSHNGGRSFGPPITAIQGHEPGSADLSCPLRPTVGVRQRAMMGARLTFDRGGDLHVVASTGQFLEIGATQTPAGLAGEAIVRHAVLRGNRVIHAEQVTTPTTDQQWAAALAALPDGGVAVSWLQTNGPGHATYDAWIATQPSGARRFTAPQRLSPASSNFPAATEAVGNSNCYGIGDYIGMVTTPRGVATVWPTTDTDIPGVDSDVLLRPAQTH
ncbi:MAG: hypothetical protein QOF18_2131 [Frankiaceae bacterium]|nr:hypothetical protein [Frankiaceae bacterium]